jgi:hypothetical protein
MNRCAQFAMKQVAYTGGVDDDVHAFNRFVEAVRFGEVSDVGKVELPGILRPAPQHLLSLCCRTRCAADAQPTTQEFVDNVGTYEAGRTGHQNIFTIFEDVNDLSQEQSIGK